MLFISQAKVTGFGTMQWGTNQFPDVLMGVRVPVLSNAECQLIYANEEILDQHICAGAVGRDACQGFVNFFLFDVIKL
jgi:Trypsin